MYILEYIGKDAILKQFDRMYTPEWAKMSNITVKRNKETLRLTGEKRAIKIVYHQTKALAERENVTLGYPKAVESKKTDK